MLIVIRTLPALGAGEGAKTDDHMDGGSAIFNAPPRKASKIKVENYTIYVCDEHSTVYHTKEEWRKHIQTSHFYLWKCRTLDCPHGGLQAYDSHRDHFSPSRPKTWQHQEDRSLELEALLLGAAMRTRALALPLPAEKKLGSEELVAFIGENYRKLRQSIGEYDMREIRIAAAALEQQGNEPKTFILLSS